MSKKELKTNAMRILDRNKIPYEYETYECEKQADIMCLLFRSRRNLI